MTIQKNFILGKEGLGALHFKLAANGQLTTHVCPITDASYEGPYQLVPFETVGDAEIYKDMLCTGTAQADNAAALVNRLHGLRTPDVESPALRAYSQLEVQIYGWTLEAA